MTVRQFHLIWAMVVCMTAVTLGLLQKIQPEEQTAHRDPASDEPIPEAPIVVIGSSLMMYAIPPISSGKNSLLGDSRKHVRLALSNITEPQTIGLLKRVIASQTEQVFVEIHPFCFDFSFQKPRDGIFQQTHLHDFIDQIRTFSVLSRRELGRRSGWHSDTKAQLSIEQTITHEPTRLDEAFHIARDSLDQVYPLHLRAPRHLDQLEELLGLAQERHLEIVLVATSRSQTAVDYIGSESADALERHIQDVARRLDLPLFQPARCWPDEYFIDQAHMNRRGRERFCNELAKWSSERP